MKKHFDKKINKTILVLAIISLVVTIVEGYFFYSGEEYGNDLFRFLLIMKNSINAFGFKSAIDIEDVIKSLTNNPSNIQIIVGYAYVIVMFVAPYCTVAFLYKLVQHMLNLRGWKWLDRKRRHIIIFGYNDEVKSLLSNEEDKKIQYKIHLVTTEITEQDELELLRKGMDIHKVDCLKLSDTKLKSFLGKIQVERADAIILFEEVSARNFSLYYMFQSNKNKLAITMKKNIKFFCRCEDDGVRRMIEDYYDTPIRSGKTEYDDLEIVSIPGLRIRKMLEKHPLHSYHTSVAKEKNPNKWNLHLLIIGFGRLGQELLLQAMNMGVTGSSNEILIDVIDYNIDEKKSIFCNNFDENYIMISDNECLIPTDNADGKLKVRFHKMDIRYKLFQELLRENGNPQKDGIYTYIAICLKNPNINLYCVSEVERYLRRYKDEMAEEAVKIAIRMEMDKQLASYLSANQESHKNVFTIEDSVSTLKLSDLLSDELNKDAKMFNRIYNTISIQPSDAEIVESIEDDEDYWKSLPLFKKESSRVLASHSKVKEDLLKLLPKGVTEQYFGVNGELMKKIGNTWVYSGTEDEFIDKINDSVNYPIVNEMARLEHRRWCYYMASRGWSRTEDKNGGKDELRRENACMCTWGELIQYKRETCCYDLMPLLMKVEDA